MGLVNAFNLMDNLDGATGAVGMVCAAGVGVAALLYGGIALAALAFALAGGCAGFLVYNLSRPSRIFLGDGGSMPLGFLVAAMAMRVPVSGQLGWSVFLLAALLLAIPILDTLLVVISRKRRGVSILTAGCDHLTHRLGARLGSARAVAATLAIVQAAVSLVAIAAAQSGRTAIIVVAACSLALGAAAIAVLERPSRPMRGRESREAFLVVDERPVHDNLDRRLSA